MDSFSIDWKSLHKDYKYFAINKSGFGYFYTKEPELKHNFWDADDDRMFAVPGNLFPSEDYENSLVIRPGFEG